MRRLMALPGLILAFAPACLFAQTRTGAPNRSTPEATIRSFADACYQSDLDAMVACVHGARRNATLEQWNSDSNGSMPHLAIQSTRTTVHGKAATVKVRLDLALLQSSTGEMFVAEEAVKLKRSSGIWRIVPATFSDLSNLIETATDERSECPPLTMLASVVAHLERLMQTGPRGATPKPDCVNNMKTLCQAATTCAGDFSGTFVFSPANLTARLTPYDCAAGTFVCPNARGASAAYSMNAALTGKRIDKILHPERLVLFYEGAGGRLTYRHKGTATVGFCDGHVERVTPKRAASLRWKP